MTFRLLDTVALRISQKFQLKVASPFAHRDDSEKAVRSLAEENISTARKVREQFKSITGYNKMLETALLLPANEFEKLFFPSFIELFNEKYQDNPQAFDVLLQAIQEELVRGAQQLKLANLDAASMGYLPYADTFRVRVLREISASLRKD